MIPTWVAGCLRQCMVPSVVAWSLEQIIRSDWIRGLLLYDAVNHLRLINQYIN